MNAELIAFDIELRGAYSSGDMYFFRVRIAFEIFRGGKRTICNDISIQLLAHISAHISSQTPMTKKPTGLAYSGAVADSFDICKSCSKDQRFFRYSNLNIYLSGKMHEWTILQTAAARI